MIETIVIDYLNSKLSVPVAGVTPEGPPASYCTVQRSGGDERDGLQAALIAVRSVGPSLWAAVQLSAEVKAAMAGLRDEVGSVFSCRLNTEYEDSRPKTMEHGYKAVFRITYV